MTAPDHAQIIRSALVQLDTSEHGFAALDALVAERDEALDSFDTQRYRAEAAEARVAELEKALRGLLYDDELCRYPPDGDTCFCSSCKRIREARAALAAAGEGGQG